MKEKDWEHNIETNGIRNENLRYNLLIKNQHQLDKDKNESIRVAIILFQQKT